MILICGPCVIDTLDKLKKDAEDIASIVDSYPEINFFFKASCVKDNRTNIKNYRGPGFEEGIKYLTQVRFETGVKVTTDFHTIEQIEKYSYAVDLIQIPAFLSMQTSLINAAIKTGKPIHIKKAQWLPPYDVIKPLSKVFDQNKNAIVFITDRGTTFGYGNVMFDPRHIKMMKDNGARVLVDITHLQNHSDIYDRTYAEQAGMAALSVGADGLFMEATYDPETAKCDADAMIPTNKLSNYLFKFVEMYNFVNNDLLDTSEKIKEYADRLPPHYIYNPIVAKGQLLKDGNRRKLKNQKVRVDALVKEVTQGSSYLDLGCNTGYFLQELSRIKKIRGVGVDSSLGLIKICNALKYLNGTTASYVCNTIHHYVNDCIRRRIKFDNVAMLSVFDMTASLNLISNFMKITKDKLFLEPTNHEKYTEEQIKELFQNKIPRGYKTKLLTVTDYQNRFLIMVEKHVEDERSTN